jgi:hypothetical protein
MSQKHIQLPEGGLGKQTTTLEFRVPLILQLMEYFKIFWKWMASESLTQFRPLDLFIVPLKKLQNEDPIIRLLHLTDRLNYCSSPINNMGWHMTVEKLIEAKLPKSE